MTTAAATATATATARVPVRPAIRYHGRWALPLLLAAAVSFPGAVQPYPDPCTRVEALGPLLMCDGFGSFNTTCAAEGNATCASTANRTCLRDDEGVLCGNCLAGYVDVSPWNGTDLEGCIGIEEVTLDMYEAAHRPMYGAGVEYETADATELEALRLQRLQQVLQVVSEARATAPPLSFALSANKFSADLPPDYAGLAGHSTIRNASAQVGFERFSMAAAADRRRSLQQSSGPLPAAVDWLEAGAVTYVKNQGRCGCCWSISCMGAVEGATFITNTYIDSLSFQQLVSCDTGVNQGCQGGNIAYALQYAVSNSFGGLTLYDDYPFVDSDGTTTTTCETAGKPLDVQVFEPVVVVSYTDTTGASDRVQAFKGAVAAQPVSITMNANCNTISAYAGGVLTDDGDCACSDVSCIDHAVLIVGYNDTYNPPYWIIKNSWGTDWGEDGYFLVAQEGGGDWGLFGILGEGVVPRKAENSTGQVSEPSSGAAAAVFTRSLSSVWMSLRGLGPAASMLAMAWSV